MSTAAKLADERWSVPVQSWLDVGSDYVFILRPADGPERWFHLRADYAATILDAACDAIAPPWTGLLAAYQLGVGPWGQEPWYTPDVTDVVRHLAAPTDSAIARELGEDVSKAREALLAFLEGARAGELLCVDDGSGRSNRFPQAEPGWTETGRPKTEAVLVLYRPNASSICGYELQKLEVPAPWLDTIASGTETSPVARTIRAFVDDPARPYTRLSSCSDLVQLASTEGTPADVARALEEAARLGLPLVLQSAGQFPCAAPAEER